jgi:drug/metabolite transporter (DMT)-like permease
MVNFILIAFSISLGVIGQIHLKQGTTHLGVTSSQPAGFFVAAFTKLFVLGGLFLYFISSLTWLMALSRVELSFAYPMLAFGYILILLFSGLILHEHISYMRILGVGLISVGVILITRS